MREAIKEAQKVSAREEVPIGAIISYKNHIIARSHNQVERLNDATAHAEILAITQASSYLSNWRLNGCSLFVTVEPCVMCIGAIILSRISNVYFGAYSQKRVVSAYDFLLTSSRTKMEGGILKDECATLLKNFFSKLRKKKIAFYW